MNDTFANPNRKTRAERQAEARYRSDENRQQIKLFQAARIELRLQNAQAAIISRRLEAEAVQAKHDAEIKQAEIVRQEALALDQAILEAHETGVVAVVGDGR